MSENALAPARVPFSFELYPPRTGGSLDALQDTIQRLAAPGPQFLSVTYGAGGSTGGRSLEVLKYIRTHTNVDPLAHLTCVGNSYAGATALIREFLDAGIESFLALRGDPPEGLDENDAFLGDLESAAQLVQLIDRVQAERAPYTEHGIPGFSAVRVEPRRHVRIAVAAFPNGHPRSRDVRQDLDALLAKQAAGATLAITQLFFHPDEYLAFVERARGAGVTMPILPGIMPITSPARMQRVLELSGEEIPAELAIALDVEPTVEGRTEIGIEYAARLAREVVAGGAPGVHLYAFNQHHVVLSVLARAGVIDPVHTRHDSTPATTAAPSALRTEGTPMTAFPAGTILGYPRIGRRRELKRAVEAHWAGRIDEHELEAQAAELRAQTRARLAELGLGRDDAAIPESFSYYDQVLDATVTLGALPARFADLRASDGSIGLAGAFTLARGDALRPPLEMTKWFDTNYHYLVPELGPDTAFSLASDRIVRQFEEAKADGFVTRPVLVGPVTYLALAKAEDGAPDGFDPLELLDRVVPVYAELLSRLAAAGAPWVQLDEPALVSESLGASPDALAAAAARVYGALGLLTDRPAILVAAGYGQLSDAAWQALAASPVEAIAIDLVRGGVPSAGADLSGTTIVGGVVDGRNIWRGDLGAAFDTLEGLRALRPASVAAGTSTSLQHVPHDVGDETDLDARLVSWLAFADQKVEQIATLARGLGAGRAEIEHEIAAASAALADRASAPGVRDGAVRTRIANLRAADRDRGDYAARSKAQEALGLPVLPTTTIGSFPQTADIRRARAAHVAGELTTDQYDGFLRDEIGRVIALQEDLGLDVLVHGEPERNDMVQYFAENLDGFAVTRNGWVQSYGSRATRPSILWGDVSRPAPITVEWSRYAQSLTDKHVKGMLTGPVTILAWSFVRDDQPLGETADQVALALRDEIADLEDAGIAIIQVDEPALRELLPLRRADQPAYLDWSVGAFRLATAGAALPTQVHTHLCYSEFAVVIDAIAALDADVTSIEAARSRGEVIGDIRESGFDHGVGPGVYDIHSPRIPSVDEIVEQLERAVAELDLRQVWVNPDCGLKTRAYPETEASLRNIVDATRRVREQVSIDA